MHTSMTYNSSYLRNLIFTIQSYDVTVVKIPLYGLLKIVELA